MLSIRARMINGALRGFRRAGVQDKLLAAYADPSTRASAVEKMRKANRRNPPKRLVRKRRHEVIDVGGFPLHLLEHPDTPRDRVLLYLHGGGYANGPDAPHWSMMADVSAEIGADCALHDYPKAPEHQSEETIESVYAAYQVLVERYGAANVVVAGDSAGGGLAVSLLLTVRDRGGDQPHAAVLISPWLDLSMSEPRMAELADRDLMLTPHVLREMGSWYAGERDLSDALISPINASTAGLAPMHLFVGTYELFLFDCRTFVEKVRADGGQISRRELPKGQHVSAIYPTREGKRARAQMAAAIGWP